MAGHYKQNKWVAVEVEVAVAVDVDIHVKQTRCSEWKRTEQRDAIQEVYIDAFENQMSLFYMDAYCAAKSLHHTPQQLACSLASVIPYGKVHLNLCCVVLFKSSMKEELIAIVHLTPVLWDPQTTS
ncbi:hypothetical protein J6590_051241 [Homalodisca vitripennis]|nr:hypothetical protein J6590_051241 [Homalodisca vitripennis]